MAQPKSATRSAIAADNFTPPLRDLIAYGGLFALVTLMLAAAISWAATLATESVSNNALDADKQRITVYIQDEPPQLDSTRATDQVSFQILGHVMEGLTRYDERNRLAAGAAKRWELRPNGATFWLRPDARWSDGKPVTAHDFVFAWRTVLDPKTASEYAFIMFAIANAEAINKGELPSSALGARAVDDYTLEVDFERPVAFFDKLVAFSVFFPIREDFYRAQDGRYGADAANLLYNGPFVMTRWVHGANLRIERNPKYWDPELVTLQGVDFGYVVKDGNTLVNLYRDGKIAWAPLTAETVDTAMEQRWSIHREITGSVYFLEFNHRAGRVTDNYHLRRAMQLVSDPSELVNKVVKNPALTPAVSLFPVFLMGVDKPFRQEYPPPRLELNVSEARRHLELAKKELGVESIPPLVMLTSDSETANKQAEYFQQLYARTLGLDVRIDKQIFKLRLAKMTAGNFDIVAAGWGPDYDDPLTFADLLASWNMNNRGRYNNPEVDRWVRVAQSSLDQRQRMDAFGQIQRLLHEDAVIVLNYEDGKIYVEDPRLQGVVRRAVGHSPDYTYAHVASSDS